MNWKKCELERANNWYEQKTEGVVESENFKILWISQSIMIGKLRQEDEALSLLIRMRERLS